MYEFMKAQGRHERVAWERE